MWDHRLAQKLFDGNKVNYWMAACLLYGIVLGLFTIPPVPNGMLVGWFFNPHIVYAEDKEKVVSLLHFKGGINYRWIEKN
jgi:hypothetical protein